MLVGNILQATDISSTAGVIGTVISQIMLHAYAIELALRLFRVPGRVQLQSSLYSPSIVSSC